MKSLLSINEDVQEEEQEDPFIRGLIEYEQKMISKLHEDQENTRNKRTSDMQSVLWQGQGIPLHLVNNQWTLLGEKTLQSIQIVRSDANATNTFMVTADGIQDGVLIEK